MGSMPWGPVVGWSWCLGVGFISSDNYAIPALDYSADNNQWFQIGADGLAGIEELMVKLGVSRRCIVGC